MAREVCEHCKREYLIADDVPKEVIVPTPHASARWNWNKSSVA